MFWAEESVPASPPELVQRKKPRMVISVNRLATAIIAIVVVIVGGIVAIIEPSTLSFRQYVETVAIGVGLLGVGYGLDAHSKP